MIKNFFDISDLSEKSLRSIINLDEESYCLENKCIGLLFEKYSTRTRLSFEVGIRHLGGQTININFDDLNIKRNESFEDTFKAFNCYLDGLIYRTSSHNNFLIAKNFFDKPIINALSEKSHPCQTISDLYTLNQHFGTLDLKILWMGDMNNVCFSLVEAANLISELNLTICTPKMISKNFNWNLNDNVKIINQFSDVDLNQINCVMTDVYVSMNDKEDNSKIDILKNFQVSDILMSETSSDSIFMHCLPAMVGMEVSKDVFYGKKSIVWKQAKNRLVAQKKLISQINWS